MPTYYNTLNLIASKSGSSSTFDSITFYHQDPNYLYPSSGSIAIFRATPIETTPSGAYGELDIVLAKSGSIEQKGSSILKMFYSGSNDEPHVGIGFESNERPTKNFEIKTKRDSNKGTEIILEGSRKTTSYQNGDELGKLIFLADSGSFENKFESGSVVELKTIVTGVGKDGLSGKFVIAVAQTQSESPIDFWSLGKNNKTISNPILPNYSEITQLLTGSLQLKDADSSKRSTFSLVNSNNTITAALQNKNNTSSLWLDGSITSSGAISSSSDIEAANFIVEDGGALKLSNNYSALTLNQGGDITLGFGGSWTMDFNKDNGVTLYEFGNLGIYRDFRIEGNNDTHLLFVTGGDAKIGIGTSTPPEKLTVEGNISSSGALIGNTLTASGLNYPSSDGTDGQVIMTDGSGILTFNDVSVYAQVKNITGGTLAKGTPVHASGSTGNTSEVIAASASVASTMPATFVLAEELAAEEEGRAIVVGYINGVNTSAFNEGDVVYVGADGGYTNAKPTGSNLIQNLGIVTKVDASNGSGFIYGAGRSNDVPNISPGYAWVGNSDSVATAVATSSFVVDNANTASYIAAANIDGTVTNASTASYVAADNIAQPFSTLEVDGPSNSHIEVGTYNVGFDQLEFNNFLITGSGLIVSGAMADANHHNFLKIGEIEIVDVNNSISSNTMLIHNVDDFILTSGSDGTNVITNNTLIRHSGNEFFICKGGESTNDATIKSTGTITYIQDTDISLDATNGVSFRAPNETSGITHFQGFSANPNSLPQQGKSIAIGDMFTVIGDGGAITASMVSASGTITAAEYVGLPSGLVSGSATVTTEFNSTGLSSAGEYQVGARLALNTYGTNPSSTAGIVASFGNTNVASTGAQSADAAARGRLVVVTDAADGDEVLLEGVVKMSTNTGWSTAKKGTPVYMSTTAGQVTTTAPSTSGDHVRIVGHVVNATDAVIYFNPENGWIEIS